MDRIKQGSLSDLRELLDEYVLDLRDADYSCNEIIFNKENEKHYLETLVWDILFRLEASMYHHDRVIDLVTINLEKMEASIRRFVPPTCGSATVKIVTEDRKIIFELIAFLSSIRSMLDSLTRLVSFYLKGVKFYSINDLRKYLEKEEPLEISILIRQHWTDWIGYLKNYRDHLIHKLTFSSTAEYEAMSIPVIRNGKKVSKRIENVASFFIPRSPKFEYILKGFRQEPFVEKTTSVFEIKDADGKVMQREVCISKAVDETRMIEIRSFVDTYLDKATSLIIQTIGILRKNRFMHFAKGQG